MSALQFPDGLLDWAGHRSGGVRKLFHDVGARPSGEIIQTGLLKRLEKWVDDLFVGDASTPSVVLLVGGPGNGKTEAIEASIRRMDSAGGLGGELVASLSIIFSAGTGRPIPRLALINVDSRLRSSFELAVVQDATVSDSERPDRTPAQLFLEDLERHALTASRSIYLVCVNRGVLDDALTEAIDSNRGQVRALLAQIVRAVGLTSDAPTCWPLERYPSVAVWPMDVESLLIPFEQDGLSPARQLLNVATKAESWPAKNSCAAGERCPHCTSRNWLEGEQYSSNLLKVLRWHELASGKRWSFRDLGSLFSFLLAGVKGSDEREALSPCESAAKLIELDSAVTKLRNPAAFQAIFRLAASCYQHSLFGGWPRQTARALRRSLRELGLEQDPTLIGLYHFINSHGVRSLPSTLERQLTNLGELMDPALADPDEAIKVNSKTEVKLRDVDSRFSQSVLEGLAFVRPLRMLTKLEVELLQRLAKSDQMLSDASVRSRRPAIAAQLQIQLREFACRLVRRSLGVQMGAVRDAKILKKFEQIIENDPELMHRAVKQVEVLLNENERFSTSLNTTFGEPSPPLARRVVLTTQKQMVRQLDISRTGRPEFTLRYIAIGNRETRYSVPLTYEGFKSVSELDDGMLPAVLPRTVVALLDTTKAKLSGQIVRDEDLIDGAELRIGLRNETIVREVGRFAVRRENDNER
jgi:hypothetical protein